MSRTWRGSLLVALVIAFAPVAAQAQPPLIGPPLTERVPPARTLIIPSFTISGEYNDNIVLDNRNKIDDFIIGYTPGIDFAHQTPTYRIGGRVSATGEKFIDHDEFSNVLSRITFLLNGSYRLTETLTLNLDEAFLLSRDTHQATTEGVGTGRFLSYSNSITPGIAWKVDPRITVRASGNYILERFDNADLHESDVYHVDAVVEREVTRRFTALAGYNFGYFDIKKSTTEPGLDATVHTPRIGAIARITDTLTLRAEGGPSFNLIRSDLHVTPFVLASMTQLLPWGEASLLGGISTTTAGGLGGPVVSYAVGASVKVTKFMRGLAVEFAPRFNRLKSVEGNDIDLRTFTLPLYASYQVTSWLALTAGYSFYRQRSDSSLRFASGASIANDADQNRVSIGIQVFYPFRFD